jgi:hypothetical protein
VVYIRESFDERNMKFVTDFRNPFLEILLKEILKLAGKLDSSRTAANYNHMQ